MLGQTGALAVVEQDVSLTGLIGGVRKWSLEGTKLIGLRHKMVLTWSGEGRRPTMSLQKGWQGRAV